MVESFWDRELPFFFWIVFVGIPTEVNRLAFDEDRNIRLFGELIDSIESTLDGGKRTMLWIVPGIRCLVGGDYDNLRVEDSSSTFDLDVHGVTVEKLK